MLTGSKPSYYLVAADTLPEVFLKVSKAKELLETGDAKTVAEAVAAVGISRSAFYKYKDKITPFVDLKSGRIMTFNMTLQQAGGFLLRTFYFCQFWRQYTDDEPKYSYQRLCGRYHFRRDFRYERHPRGAYAAASRT